MSQETTRTIENRQEDTILSPEEILNDFRICVRSRHASLVGRREVMSGKAKFGIFGDGKEIVQVAIARVFQPGDFRSGYYRDQTLMFALGELTVQQYFAQLYADSEPGADPASSGRLMNSHFATHFLNSEGAGGIWPSCTILLQIFHPPQPKCPGWSGCQQLLSSTGNCQACNPFPNSPKTGTK